ncbi:MAG: flippase [Candidatus Moranbacteria bacterium]|nr:flippase [Candidatus Moranbacteria bacterium]
MKHFSRALLWLTVSEIVFNVSGYLIHSVVGRLLGPNDYGRYGLIVNLTTTVIILIGNGIPTAMSKYLAEIFETHPEKIRGIKRKTIFLQTTIMTAVTGIFFLLSRPIALLLGDDTLTPLFRLSSLIIPSFAAASFYFYYFTGLHFFRIQAFLKTTRALTRMTFIILLAMFFGVNGAVSGYIISPLVVFGIAIICDIVWTHKYFPAVGIKKSPGFPAKKLLDYAWPLTLFLLFYQLITSLDLFLVKALLHDDHQTGLYNAVITVGNIPYYLFYALTIILLPAISKTSANRDEAETRSLVNKSLRLLALILFPTVTLLSAYSGPVIRMFYGHAYIDATTSMGIFAIGNGFLTVFYVLAFAISGAGLVMIPMYVSGAGLIVSAVLNTLLIPPLGIVGSAIATTIVTFVLMIGVLAFTDRHFKVRIPLKLWLISFGSSAILVLLSKYLPQGSFSFLVSAAVLFLLHFGILRFFGVLEDADIAPLRKLLAIGK